MSPSLGSSSLLYFLGLLDAENEGIIKLQLLLTQQCGVTPQNPSVFSDAAVRTSNLPLCDVTYTYRGQKVQPGPHLEALGKHDQMYIVLS